MAMDVGARSFSRNSFYVVNTLVLIMGIVTLGISAWVVNSISGSLASPRVDPTGAGQTQRVQDMFDTQVGRIASISNVMIAASVIVIIVAAGGFYAAYKYNRTMLITYSALVLLVVIMQFSSIVAHAGEGPAIILTMTEEFRNSLDDYDYIKTTVVDGRVVAVIDKTTNYDNRTMPATTLMNMFMSSVGCCGYDHHAYTDFKNSAYWTKAGPVPPVFCCKFSDTLTLQLVDPSCAQTRTPENSNMKTGCLDKVNNWMHIIVAPKFIGAGCVGAIVNIVGIAVAMYLYHTASSEYKEF